MSPPGAGSFGILGGLLLPLSMIIAWRKRPPGPVGALVKAGATDASVALRPKTAGIGRSSDLDRFILAGVVRELDDGRVWVDVAALKRRQLRVTAVVGGIVAIAVVGGWLLAGAVGLA